MHRCKRAQRVVFTAGARAHARPRPCASGSRPHCSGTSPTGMRLNLPAGDVGLAVLDSSTAARAQTAQHREQICSATRLARPHRRQRRARDSSPSQQLRRRSRGALDHGIDVHGPEDHRALGEHADCLEIHTTTKSAVLPVENLDLIRDTAKRTRRRDRPPGPPGRLQTAGAHEESAC